MVTLKGMNVRILQWNVWYKEPIETIAQNIKELHPDIICLQELTSGLQKDNPNTVGYIAKILGGYDFHGAAMDNQAGFTQINAIFSKFPITMRRQEWINTPHGRGGYDDEYRSYVEVEISIDDKKLTVGTTHMSYTDQFEETHRKKQETDNLISHLSTNKPYVLTGDFNALPDSYTIAEINKILVNAGPAVDQNTWTTKPFSYNGFASKNLDWRLDHVFVSSDIHVVSSDIKITSASDHLPILTTIRL